MNAGKRFVAAIALATIVAVAGCATALFFPVKAAENAADKFIDAVWSEVDKPAATRVEAKKS